MIIVAFLDLGMCIYISEVGKSEQSESNREIGFGSVALRCDAKLCGRVRERVLTK